MNYLLSLIPVFFALLSIPMGLYFGLRFGFFILRAILGEMNVKPAELQFFRFLKRAGMLLKRNFDEVLPVYTFTIILLYISYPAALQSGEFPTDPRLPTLLAVYMAVLMYFFWLIYGFGAACLTVLFTPKAKALVEST